MPEQAKTPHQQFKQFPPGTDRRIAAKLVAQAFQAISAGWPAVYFKTGAFAGSVPTIDLDAMIRDAGALAVEIQHEANRRQTRMEVDHANS